MLRKIVASLGALLALFHVWVFAGQAWSGRLAEPGPLLRWLLAFGLIAALVSLRRRGAPLLFGKHAVAIWLLAALLHGPAVAARIDDGFAPMMPEVVATLSQVAASVLGLALTIAFVFAAGRTSLPVLRSCFSLHRGSRRAAIAVAVRAGQSPRPPPARLAR